MAERSLGVRHSYKREAYTRWTDVRLLNRDEKAPYQQILDVIIQRASDEREAVRRRLRDEREAFRRRREACDEREAIRRRTEVFKQKASDEREAVRRRIRDEREAIPQRTDVFKQKASDEREATSIRRRTEVFKQRVRDDRETQRRRTDVHISTSQSETLSLRQMQHVIRTPRNVNRNDAPLHVFNDIVQRQRQTNIEVDRQSGQNVNWGIDRSRFRRKASQQSQGSDGEIARVLQEIEYVDMYEDQNEGTHSTNQLDPSPGRSFRHPKRQQFGHSPRRKGVTKLPPLNPREEENCAVCLCPLGDPGAARILPCLHKFHRRCIGQWLREKPECPVCRTEVSAE